MKTLEKWKPIIEYKGYKFTGKYEVSNWGNIRNKQTLAPLATYSNGKGQGYLKTKIQDTSGVRRALYIHQLVAFYFLPEQPENTEVNHKDGNFKNNSISNLEYLTHADNVRHYTEGRKAV